MELDWFKVCMIDRYQVFNHTLITIVIILHEIMYFIGFILLFTRNRIIISINLSPWDQANEVADSLGFCQNYEELVDIIG